MHKKAAQYSWSSVMLPVADFSHGRHVLSRLCCLSFEASDHQITCIWRLRSPEQVV